MRQTGMSFRSAGRARRAGAPSIADYLFASGGIGTSWQSFTGIIGPGFNAVSTPKSQYV